MGHSSSWDDKDSAIQNALMLIGLGIVVILYFILLARHIINQRYYTLQKLYLRISFFPVACSIFAITAFMFPSTYDWTAVIRGLFEAFAIVSFFQLMVDFVGFSRVVEQLTIAYNPSECFCLKRTLFFYPITGESGLKFLYVCVCQYMFIKPMLLLIEAGLDPNISQGASFIIRAVTLLSTITAFRSLLLLARPIFDHMKPLNAIRKFAWLKIYAVLVILIEAIFRLMLTRGAIEGNSTWDDHEQMARIQSVFILVPSIVFMILVFFFYSPAEDCIQKISSPEIGNQFLLFLNSFAVWDIFFWFQRAKEEPSGRKDLSDSNVEF